MAQRDSFAKDIHSLQTTKGLNSKSSILSLNPFLDGDGMLRVGDEYKVHRIVLMTKYIRYSSIRGIPSPNYFLQGNTFDCYIVDRNNY